MLCMGTRNVAGIGDGSGKILPILQKSCKSRQKIFAAESGRGSQALTFASITANLYGLLRILFAFVTPIAGRLFVVGDCLWN
jgi:hypothetical protein